jgi:hypothetical protein
MDVDVTRVSTAVKRNFSKFFSSPTAMDDVSRFFSLITGVIQSMISPGLFFMSFL